MNDSQLLSIDVEPVNAIAASDAYQRLFRYLSQIKNPEHRDAALADLNMVYGMTSQAIETSERALQVSRTLKAMLDEAMMQRDQAIMQLYTERKEAADERELMIAESVCSFFMLDKKYAVALLDVLQGYCDDYDIDGFVLEEVRDAFLTLELDMRDADEAEQWLNDEGEAQVS